MKKSKHFRKDVILARIIAGVLLIILIVLLAWGISVLTKSSDGDKNSENSQNTENLVPEDQDVYQEPETEWDSGQEESTEGQQEMPEVDENQDTIYVPDKVYVETTAKIRLREEPNTSCATLDRISSGTKLEVLETLDGWYKVNYNGKDGYVSADYVKIVEE